MASKVPVIGYESLEKTGHAEYSQNIAKSNRRSIDKIREILSENRFPSGPDFIYCTTGSDGRLEKGPDSELELLLLHKDHPSPDDAVKQARIVLKSRFPEAIREESEIRNLNDPERSLSEYTIGDSGRDRRMLIPTRITDAFGIYGNPEILTYAKETLADELKSDDKLRKKVREHITSMRKMARQVTETGKSRFRGIPQNFFDVERGISFYLREGEYQESFKLGPLRLVQYTLSSDFAKRTADDRSVPASEMPTNISERLSYLQSEGLTTLSPEETGDLADCYQYFLWQYHRSQENFRLNGQSVTEFDSKEVRERLNAVLKLTRSISNPKKQRS